MKIHGKLRTSSMQAQSRKCQLRSKILGMTFHQLMTCEVWGEEKKEVIQQDSERWSRIWAKARRGDIQFCLSSMRTSRHKMSSFQLKSLKNNCSKLVLIVTWKSHLHNMKWKTHQYMQEKMQDGNWKLLKRKNARLVGYVAVKHWEKISCQK